MGGLVSKYVHFYSSICLGHTYLKWEEGSSHYIHIVGTNITRRAYLLEFLTTFQWLNMAFMTANSGHPNEMPPKLVGHKFEIQTFNIHLKFPSWIKCLILGLSIHLNVSP